MYWNETLEIGKEIETTIDYEIVKDYQFQTVFCNEVSIRQSEFYYANQQGLKPEIAFELRKEEYSGETVFRWNDKTYYLVRTFNNQKNGTVEIYLTSVISDKNEYEVI